MKLRIPILLWLGRVTAALFSPTIGSGRSGLAMSQSGRRLRIGGRATKFSCGGGEVVAHSGVQGSQGVSPGLLPRKNEVARFQTRISADALMKKTPMVESMFIQPQCGRSGYGNTGLGIPSNPRKGG